MEALQSGEHLATANMDTYGESIAAMVLSKGEEDFCQIDSLSLTHAATGSGRTDVEQHRAVTVLPRQKPVL